MSITKELKSPNNLQEVLFEYAPDAYYISDLKGVILDGNKASEKITGYDREELIGKDFFKTGLLQKKDIAKALKLLAKNAIGMPTGPDEITIIKKDGSKAILEINTHPVNIQGDRCVLGIARDISAKKKIERSLKKSSEDYREMSDFLVKLMDTIPNPIFYKDLEGKYRGCNRVFADTILGMPKKQIIGNTVIDLDEKIPGDLARTYHKKDMELMKSGGSQEYDSEVRCADGLRRYYRFYKAVYSDKHGRKAGLIGIMLDISKSKEFERRLIRSEDKFRTIFDLANDSIMIHDFEGNIIDSNKSASSLLGYKKEEFRGMDIAKLNKPENSGLIKERLKKLKKKGSIIFESEALKKNGETVNVEISSRRIKIEGKEAVLAITRDISERKKTEKLMKDLAYKDTLTGLPNRRLYEDRFDVARSDAKRKGHRLAVIVLDLDDFKSINDTHGHLFGDDVIKTTADKLKKTIRSADTVARLGGDEFILLLNDIKSIEDIDRVASKILDSFSAKSVVSGKKIDLHISMGISIYPDDGRELEELIRNSDSAMYWIKNHGKNAYRIFGKDE